MPKKLTEKEFWDRYWDIDFKDVAEIKRTKRGLHANAILDALDKHLPRNKNFHVLEIGGAPGQYLIYMAKNFNYHLHSLDYSKIGNDRTVKNLAAANIPIAVYEKDFFSDDFTKDLPLFDIVYSLGFIEHFEDLSFVVGKHLDLLKTGGILLLGVPNLGAVYKHFLKRTAPHILSMHNLDTMKINNWDKFENELNLTCIFKGYIGGFEPLVMNKLEKSSFLARLLNLLVKILVGTFSFRFNFLRKFNSRYWSGYLIGIYTKN